MLRIVFVLAVCTSLVACQKPIDEGVAIGRYQLGYEEVEDTLTLSRNGSYLHVWGDHGRRSEERGAWSLQGNEGGCRRLSLVDFSALRIDATGNSRRRSDLWESCIERSLNGRPVITVDEDLNVLYTKVSD